MNNQLLYQVHQHTVKAMSMAHQDHDYTLIVK